MKETSSLDGFLCLASYHSDNVETIIGDDWLPSENLASRASACFFFILAIPPIGQRLPESPDSKKGTLPKGLLKSCRLFMAAA
jgi:hypothetical protein